MCVGTVAPVHRGTGAGWLRAHVWRHVGSDPRLGEAGAMPVTLGDTEEWGAQEAIGSGLWRPWCEWGLHFGAEVACIGQAGGRATSPCSAAPPPPAQPRHRGRQHTFAHPRPQGRPACGLAPGRAGQCSESGITPSLEEPQGQLRWLSGLSRVLSSAGAGKRPSEARKGCLGPMSNKTRHKR